MDSDYNGGEAINYSTKHEYFVQLYLGLVVALDLIQILQS